MKTLGKSVKIVHRSVADGFLIAPESADVVGTLERRWVHTPLDAQFKLAMTGIETAPLAL